MSTSDWTGFKTVLVLSEKQQWENNIKIKKYQLIIFKEVRGGRRTEIAIDRFLSKGKENDRLQACLYR